MKKWLLLSFLLAAVSLCAQPRYCENPASAVMPFGTWKGYVVLPEAPTEVERQAAAELYRLLGYEIVSEESASLAEASARRLPKVYVGNTRHLRSMAWSADSLRDDGYLLMSDGTSACLYGREGKGTLYAAYRLLELMGFRLYAPEALMLVSEPDTMLPTAREWHNPSFRYREILYYYLNHSDFYLNWHGLHNRVNLARDWGMFVHTFQHLIPAERYFDTHPEWFTEMNGQRVRDGQLCLSNPEVLDTLCAHLALRMAERPEASIWSVSNNDNYNACQCPDCRRMDSLYGGPSGTLIHFVNQVARRFPDKVISTLGYQFTRQAPRQDAPQPQRPDSNVNIMFCSIECGRQEAIATAPGEAQFRKDMQDWASLTDNIFMWDYVVQFRNFWDPFPNLHVLQPNLRFFHDNGVRMMFEQGTGEHNRTSWMDIRCYLLAKLLWDVDADVDSLLRDFCRYYYGDPQAGRQVETVLHEMHAALRSAGPSHLNIYGYAVDAAQGYLQPSLLHKFDSLMALAYRAEEQHDAADAAARRYYGDHLRYFELALDYARLELTMGGYLPLDETFLPLADRFVADCDRMGVVNMHEMGYPVADYRRDIDHYVEKRFGENRARGCRVTMSTPPDARYEAQGPQSLTDGVAGMLDYRHDWIGLFGDTLEAVVDLGRRQPLQYVGMDFYFYPLSWIFLPQRVEFFLSRDGRHWEKVGDLVPENPERLAVPEICTLSANGMKESRLASRGARYVKVVATPLPVIPQWHRSTGNPVWTFSDEIVVR